MYIDGRIRIETRVLSSVPIPVLGNVVSVKTCYQCLRECHELSKRSRCVHCECERSIANEKELEELQTVVAAIKDELMGLQLDMAGESI